MRYVLDVSYDGTQYAGWQFQPNATAVQEVLETALSTLMRKPVSITGAGRTDAGVHAQQMIAHFDWDLPLPEGFLHKFNGLLPWDIAVNAVFRAVLPDFHARFTATKRAYQFRVTLQKNPFEARYALWFRQSPDLDILQSAAAALMDFQDFASFCKAHGNNKTTLCFLTHSEWEIHPTHLVYHVGADRFLRGMVRALVGTLLEVGTGKISLERFRQIIRAKDRSLAGPNVVAKGLSLTEVHYPAGSWEPLP